jgi:hypothetical protein
MQAPKLDFRLTKMADEPRLGQSCIQRVCLEVREGSRSGFTFEGATDPMTEIARGRDEKCKHSRRGFERTSLEGMP